MKNIHAFELIQNTLRKFINPNAEVLSVENQPIHMGLQAVDLNRHHVQFKTDGAARSLSLISKRATSIERRVLSRLYSQKANVPFSLSHAPDEEERSLLCIQDVDFQTDYTNLNMNALQKKEPKVLAHIHISNYGQRKELSWLPAADGLHIEKMVNERWLPQWETAKRQEPFLEVFGEYLSSVEAVAATISEDMKMVIHDEQSQTLIHNDLNPGNVLVQHNTDVFFIDWEETRYGSLFLDVPLRCRTQQQIEEYREVLADANIEISSHRFEQLYQIASRYLGLRYMSWNLGAWTSHSQAKEDLRKYLDMVVG
ncbi:phosphotransferase [Paenibacillus filicis]|uniref:Phosphotransferase n=1 Tax=Paenibacillus filicis TaxID=669464 RepID=A0ABU9DM89_9BACL